MANHSTNPQKIARRIKRLKKHLGCTYWDLAVMFGVRPLTVQRWANAEFAPRLESQKILLQLERKHKLN